MIRITKHGSLAYEFTCTECACEFESNGDEIEITSAGQKFIKCPECHAILEVAED